jgi:hypothetical protein
MRRGSGVDDPCGGRRRESLAQPSGENEIGHVVERKVAPQPVLGHLARSERRAGVVDQNIDARLLVGDLCRHPFHFRQAREIGEMQSVGGARGAAAQSRQRRVSPRLAPPHRDDASAHFSERQRGNLADSRRGTGDDDSFASHDVRAPAASSYLNIVPGRAKPCTATPRLRSADAGLDLRCVAGAVHRLSPIGAIAQPD